MNFKTNFISFMNNFYTLNIIATDPSLEQKIKFEEF